MREQKYRPASPIESQYRQVARARSASTCPQQHIGRSPRQDNGDRGVGIEVIRRQHRRGGGYGGKGRWVHKHRRKRAAADKRVTKAKL